MEPVTEINQVAILRDGDTGHHRRNNRRRFRRFDGGIIWRRCRTHGPYVLRVFAPVEYADDAQLWQLVASRLEIVIPAQRDL